MGSLCHMAGLGGGAGFVSCGAAAGGPPLDRLLRELISSPLSSDFQMISAHFWHNNL